MSIPNPTHLLWLDLESTGLDTAVDEIIEIGVIITDLHYDSVIEYRTVVLPTEAGKARLRDNPFVTEMHRLNGLTAELDALAGASYTTIEAAEERVLALIDVIGLSAATFHIAGSGVATFDRPLLNRLMPRLAAKLHYAPIDVGILRRSYKLATGVDLVEVNEDKTHRAIDDVRCHLTEGRAFRELFRSTARTDGQLTGDPPMDETDNPLSDSSDAKVEVQPRHRGPRNPLDDGARR